jgi:hypothetical protein
MLRDAWTLGRGVGDLKPGQQSDRPDQASTVLNHTCIDHLVYLGGNCVLLDLRQGYTVVSSCRSVGLAGTVVQEVGRAGIFLCIVKADSIKVCLHPLSCGQGHSSTPCKAAAFYWRLGSLHCVPMQS